MVNHKSATKKRKQAFGSTAAYKKPKYAKKYRKPNLVTMGFLGIENKFYDTKLAAATLTADTGMAGAEQDPSATSMITTPIQGDGEQNRDGRKIAINSCYVNGVIDVNATEAATEPLQGITANVCLVLDTQTNGAQMNSEDCFKNLAATAIGTTGAIKNLLFGNRFRVLVHKQIDCTPQSISQIATNDYSQAGSKTPFKLLFNWNKKPLVINFNSGTTASVANVIDNSLHVIAWVNNVTPVGPKITYNARIRFTG